MPFIAPEPKWLTLPEAVAQAAPPLDKMVAQRTIMEALSDGRLKDRPTALMSRKEASRHLEHLQKMRHRNLYPDAVWRAAGEITDALFPSLRTEDDEDAHRAAVGEIEAMTVPRSSGANAWRRWFEEGAVDWHTGEVRWTLRTKDDSSAVPLVYRPKIARIAVLELFGQSATENAPGKRSGRAQRSEVKKWFALRVEKWPSGQLPPSEAADLEAIRQEVAPNISREEFRRVRRECVPPEWLKRGPRGPRNRPR